MFAKTLQRIFVSLVFLSIDLAFFGLGCFAAFYLRFYSGFPLFEATTVANPTAYWMALFLAVYFVEAQLLAFGLYGIDRFRSWREDAQAIVRSVSAATILLLSLSFFYRSVEFSRQMVVMAWPLSILTLLLGRVLLRGAIYMARRHGILRRRAFIFGHDTMYPILADRLKGNEGLGLDVMGYFSEGPVSEELALGLPHLGGMNDLESAIQKHRARVVFFLKENYPQDQTLSIIEVCEKNHVELLMVPQVYDLLIGFSGTRDLAGLPLVELREEPLSVGTLLVKRLVDFSCGLFLFTLTLPLQIAIGVMIRMDSPGGALFCQERVGYRGRTFRMWKFRSMVKNAEQKITEVVDLNNLSEPVFKVKNDPRITRVGAWLRRTSLDELPQLWNVITGDMSLVGPRPEEVMMVSRYNVWQRRRLKVKPGITGLQQIKCRGTTSLVERIKYDIFYIRRLSILFDFEIMFKTIWVVISQKGAH